MLCLLQVMVRIRGKPFQCGKKEVVVIVVVVVWLSISSINSTPPPTVLKTLTQKALN